MTDIEQPHRMLDAGWTPPALPHRTGARRQPAARVGQVWKSTDRRENRWVRVVEIDAQFAVVEPCEPTGEPHHNPRRTRVRLDPAGRLNRYRLVQDPPLPGLGEDAPVARTSSPTMSDPTTVPCDCSCHRCCVPMDASCEDCEDNHDDH